MNLQKGGVSYKIVKTDQYEDYDKLFADQLTKIKPPYDINKLLDYYLNKNDGFKGKFFKHIKYVVIPGLKRKRIKMFMYN